MAERVPGRDELVDATAAMRELGITERRFWHAVRDRGLARYRIPGEGKKTFVLRAELERAVTEPVLIAPKGLPGEGPQGKRLAA